MLGLGIGLSAPANMAETGSLLFDFMSGNLGAGLSLTRASVASYHDAAGVMRMASADQPRFDYDPVTLAPRGLLIEAAGTNLMAWSEEMTSGRWLTVQNGMSTPVPGPRGAAAAYRFVPAAGSTSNQRLKSPAVSATAGSVYSMQAWMRAVGCRYVSITGPTVGISAVVDLVAGTITGAGARIAASVNGWHLVLIEGRSAPSTASDGINFWASDAAGSVVFAGDGVAGFEVWHPQLEAGARATSYIPTVGGTTTRAADALAPLSLSPIWAAAGVVGGTILMDVDAGGPVNTTRGYLWMISDAGLSRLALRAWNQGLSDDSCALVVGDGAGNTDLLIATALRGRQRIAASYINGAAPLVSLSGAAVLTSARNYTHDPANTTITFGGGFYGHLRSIRIYRGPMIGPQLRALTA